MGITQLQEQELLRLFQITILKNFGNRSVLGGMATVAHHFKQGRYNSIKFYMPGGFPLGEEQHTGIHNGGDTGAFLSRRLEKYIGKKGLNDLDRQKNTILKDSDLDYDKIKAHILGERSNYL